MTTATTDIPLGRLEDQRLEFKSRDALDNPEKIAREVVAMLNANGGEVWIGLREEGGRAMEIEPISDAEAARDRLHDHLVDTLEPAPTGEEVVIETVEISGGERPTKVLRITVKPTPDRAPYAWLRNGAWNFPIRVGARIRSMSREEVQRAFSSNSIDGTDGADEAKRVKERLSNLREKALKDRLAGLWLAVSPRRELSLDLQAPIFDELATNPRASGNRRSGWNFAKSHEFPELTTDSIQWGLRRGTLPDNPAQRDFRVKVMDTGEAKFFANFACLNWREEDLYPFTLLEYPISAFRILGKIYEGKTTPDSLFFADIALLRVQERGLRPGSPGIFSRELYQRPSQEGEDLILNKPLVFSAEEITTEPDRCGYRLVRMIYQGFGLREDAIPEEFDKKSGRLIFQE